MATTSRTAATRAAAVAALLPAPKPAKRATTRAAAPAAAADKAKARTARAAKPAAATVAAPAYVVSIGGTHYSTPFALGEFVSPLLFTQAVVASLAWAHTGILPTSVDHVASSRALYTGALRMADGTLLPFAFGAPALVAKRDAVTAAQPAKPAPAPAATAARKVASEAARATSLTVAPKLAGGMPVAEAAAVAKAAIAANESTRYVITAKGLGHFTADKLPGQSWGGFVSTAIAPRVQELATWARCSTETVTRGDAGEFRARLSDGKGNSLVIEGKPDAAAAAPVPAGTPLPAFVTRAGVTVAAPPAAPARPVGSLAKALAARDALNAPAPTVGKATPAGAQSERARHLAIAARGRAALREAQPPRRTAKVQALYDIAATGVLPTAPDFSAPTHARYVKPLAEVVAKVAARDVAWLKAHPMTPDSSSRVMLCRYRDLAIIALEAKAAKAAAKAAKAGK